jgi:hypothetical protein
VARHGPGQEQPALPRREPRRRRRVPVPRHPGQRAAVQDLQEPPRARRRGLGGGAEDRVGGVEARALPGPPRLPPGAYRRGGAAREQQAVVELLFPPPPATAAPPPARGPAGPARAGRRRPSRRRPRRGPGGRASGPPSRPQPPPRCPDPSESASSTRRPPSAAPSSDDDDCASARTCARRAHGPGPWRVRARDLPGPCLQKGPRARRAGRGASTRLPGCVLVIASGKGGAVTRCSLRPRAGESGEGATMGGASESGGGPECVWQPLAAVSGGCPIVCHSATRSLSLPRERLRCLCQVCVSLALLAPSRHAGTAPRPTRSARTRRRASAPGPARTPGLGLESHPPSRASLAVSGR